MAEVETLEDWSDEQKKALVATAKYGVLSESIRSSMAEARLCSMFCGGKTCKYEGAAKWSPEQQAIKGLYSNWITPNILAMARPNTEQIKKHNIIDQFLQVGIRSIINLQLCGEHASCGPGLESSGFTYVPQEFMDQDVFFYNFGWHDYNVGTLTGMADVVRVMQFALSQGKVAIHCHAGLGRTGVLIACYLVFANRLDPDIAINYVRRKRPGSIQSRCQIQCIRDFAEFLRPSRIVFSSIKPKIPDFTLSQFLSRQKFAVHGNEARRLRYLPKIIYVCCERLLELASRQCTNDEHKTRLFITADRFLPSNSTAVQKSLFRSTSNQPVKAAAGHAMRHNGQVTSIPKNPLVAAISMRVSISCESLLPLRARASGTGADHLSPPPSTASLGPGSGSSTPNPRLLPSLTQPNLTWSDVTRDADVPGRLPGNATARLCRRSSIASSASAVIEALGNVKLDCSPESLVSVDDYKRKLNISPTEWWRLRAEEDPLVLAALMWDWFDELREPVLSIQELPLLLDGIHQPVASLNYLDKGARQTIGFLFYTIACLEPMTPSQRGHVIQRAVSTLTHQSMTLELDDVVTLSSMSYEDRNRLMQRSTNEGRMRSDVARRLNEFFERYMKQMTPCECVAERMTSRRLDLPPTSSGRQRQQQQLQRRVGAVAEPHEA